VTLPENQAVNGENKHHKFAKKFSGESKQNAIHLEIKRGKAAHTKHKSNNIRL
jgi:hypothetical protein